MRRDPITQIRKWVEIFDRSHEARGDAKMHNFSRIPKAYLAFD